MYAAESIYNHRRILEREIAKLRLDKNNGTILLRYYRSRRAEGLSLARIVKCISIIGRAYYVIYDAVYLGINRAFVTLKDI